MGIWAIADSHLSFSSDKPMDIFGSKWENHHEKLATAWKKLIASDDIVLMPGDISWAMNLDGAKADLSFINDLPGKKIIGRGNHDYWWTSLKKMEAFCQKHHLDTLQFMKNNAFSFSTNAHEQIIVCGTRGWLNPTDYSYKPSKDEKIFNREVIRLELSLKEANKMRTKDTLLIVAFHFPPHHKLSHNTAFTEVLEKNKVDICIYGHVHGKLGNETPEGIYNGVNYINVASDHLAFIPKKIAD